MRLDGIGSIGRKHPIDDVTPFAPSVQIAEHDRTLVVASRFVGAGYIAYFIIALAGFGKPAGLVASWFDPVGAVCALGPGVVLLMLTLRPAGRRFIPVAAVACWCGYLIACGLWYVAWTGRTAPTESVTWLANFSGLPALALVLVYPAYVGVLGLTVTCLAASSIINAARAVDGHAAYPYEVVFGVLFTCAFLFATRMVVRTGKLLDETRNDAVDAASRSASASARNVERARFDALIHDRVIATLVAAKNNRDDPRLAAQAQAALAELAVVGGQDVRSELTAAEALARLRTVVSGSAIDVPVEVDYPEDFDRSVPRYPASVVRALAEAIGEAVRNSAIHAGPGADCAVLIELGAARLRATVVDDGVGFDPDTVPPERLGIEVSIRQRISGLDAGWSRIRSEIGRGTTVQVAWGDGQVGVNSCD